MPEKKHKRNVRNIEMGLFFFPFFHKLNVSQSSFCPVNNYVLFANSQFHGVHFSFLLQ